MGQNGTKWANGADWTEGAEWGGMIRMWRNKAECAQWDGMCQMGRKRAEWGGMGRNEAEQGVWCNERMGLNVPEMGNKEEWAK